MTLSNTSGVYGIFCKANGKVYIGGTTKLRNRRGQHFCDLRKGIHCCRGLQELFTRYGSGELSFEVIEEVASKGDLDLVEQKWIDFYLEAGAILNECKTAGTTKGRNRGEEEKARISLGLVRYYAMEFKEPRDIAQYLEEYGEQGLRELTNRQLKVICSLLRICGYSYMLKQEMVEEILQHGKKDRLLEIVRSGKKLEPRPYKRRESTKPDPEPYTVRRAAQYKNKEFWIISEGFEEFKIVSLDDLVLKMETTHQKAISFISRDCASLNGFHLLAVRDTVTDGHEFISDRPFYTFQSPSLEEFNTLNVMKLSLESGLGSKTLTTLKNGYCRTNRGWKYLGETNIITGQFTPNRYLKEELRSTNRVKRTA